MSDIKPQSININQNEAFKLFERMAWIESAPSNEEFECMTLHQEYLIPLMLQELKHFADNPSQIESLGNNYIRHILVIFLLAHWRQQAAFPLIVQLISHTGKQVMSLMGEVFSEALGRILASVYHHDLSLLKQVIENTKLDPWLRSGALDSFMVLWKEGVLPREDVIHYLHELMQHKLEKHPSYVWDTVALIAYDMHPAGLEDVLRDAINAKHIEPVVLNHETLKSCLQQPVHLKNQQKSQVLDGFIKSPTMELSWWLYPDRKVLQKGKDYEALDVPIVDKEVIPGERVPPIGWRSNTVIRGTKKIGRNEPCPCGSHKKYKKCCLRIQ